MLCIFALKYGHFLNLLKKLQLAVDYKEQVLICYRYGYALTIKHSQVTSHLRDNYQVSESDRKGLTRYEDRGIK
jgi:hypothetical protein